MHENSDWRNQISSFVLQNILPSASPEKKRNQGKYHFYLMFFNFYNHYFVWLLNFCLNSDRILSGIPFTKESGFASKIVAGKKFLRAKNPLFGFAKSLIAHPSAFCYCIEVLNYFQKFLWFFLNTKVWSRVAANSKEIKLWDRLIEVDAVCYILSYLHF